MAAGQPGEAITALDKAARQRPDDSHIQRLLSDAYGKRGDRFGAHRHLAEHLYLSGQLEPTIRQLEIALRQPDLSFYQSAELEARLSEVKAEFDALKKSDKSAGRR